MRKLLARLIQWALGEKEAPAIASSPESNKDAKAGLAKVPDILVRDADLIVNEIRAIKDKIESAPHSADSVSSASSDLIPLDDTGVDSVEVMHTLWKRGIIPQVKTMNARGRAVRAISKEDLARVSGTSSGGFRRVSHGFVQMASKHIYRMRYSCPICSCPMSGTNAKWHIPACAVRRSVSSGKAYDLVRDSDFAQFLDDENFLEDMLRVDSIKPIVNLSQEQARLELSVRDAADILGVPDNEIHKAIKFWGLNSRAVGRARMVVLGEAERAVRPIGAFKKMTTTSGRASMIQRK